jgi:putative PIN family toxin of toxin-antitoxin system
LMRVLLDTNVLAASLTSEVRASTTPPATIWQLRKGKRFILLVSIQVLEELEHTLADPWFIDRIDPETRKFLQNDLLENSELVEISMNVSGVASHASDDEVLSAAVAGNADYLVTGDAEFRRVGEYQGVKLRTPAEFLREIDRLSF